MYINDKLKGMPWVLLVPGKVNYNLLLSTDFELELYLNKKLVGSAKGTKN